MDSEDIEKYGENVAFPPANFSIWPETRIGALAIDVLLIVVVLLLWFIPRKVFSVSNVDDNNSVTHYTLVSQFKMWGFWVAGLDTVYIRDGEVFITKRRGSSCCSLRDLTFPVSSVRKIDVRRRRLFSLGLVWAFFISCLCGIWLHFIPCIWWTCDWGYFDGQGVRGAIWFITWGILFIVLAFLYRVIEVVITVQLDPTNEKTKDIYLAIGEGVGRDRDDPVVVYDLEQLRKGIYRVPTNSHKFVYYN